MSIHRATVSSNIDPEGEGRLQVSDPATGSTAWAARVFPIAAFVAQDVPIGAEVWIAYEGDDPAQPVVLGLVHAPSRRDALARDLEALGDAWDRGHAAGAIDADADGDGTGAGAASNPYR
ncbi:phage baseplate assembly protein V [Microbacterium rhizomatis]|uniref:Gp5/Type VI secretion system Vgr protein OB-fold domain-containing protein n=1 Tax=Microbacterium rhizomatis TaxID=1631477 RepID=A0A5J5J427_9MICO|nr:phage baseplate assembly protein V [Microbacterium rhizomatis]KAA9110209.1 hypothetical protein F6B43_00425 [Microbacterium rhizomatis]